MRRVGWCLVVSLLAVSTAVGDDPAKDEKKEPTPKGKFQALVKEFSAKQREALTEVRNAKGEEQQKAFAKYSAVGREFAEQFHKLIDDHSTDPVATDAVFWIVQNAAGSPAAGKVADRLAALVAEMPLNDLAARLNRIRGGGKDLVEAVVKRAEKDQAESKAADLLAWAVTNGATQPAGQRAIDRLIDKYPDHAAVERVCMMLGRGFIPGSTESLKRILEKAEKPKVKSAAAMALGQLLASKADELSDKPTESDKVAAEAETYFEKAIELADKDSPSRKEAEQELNVLRTLRVGKEAPEIAAEDLDGKEFKLSDYRGKVVLLDFWGHW